MIHLVRRIWRDFPTWERRVQIAVGLAIFLLLVAVVALFAAPREARLPILIGAFGLVVVTQIAVLYAYRGMVNAYTQAQRFYLAADYAKTVSTLKLAQTGKPLSTPAQVLLGNAYRQLGQLESSRSILSEVLNNAANTQVSNHHAMYALGRTLIALGEYEDAAAQFQAALNAGAPKAVQLDLAEAFYRAQNLEGVHGALSGIDRESDLVEVPRLWLYDWLCVRTINTPLPASALTKQALPFWRGVAAQFADTAYGRDVARDLALFEQAQLDLKLMEQVHDAEA